VRDDRVVVGGVLERNEDAAIHEDAGSGARVVGTPQASHPCTVWTSSHTFNTAITPAVR
jgi:hypothetical protein